MRRTVMVFQMLLTKMVSALECTSNSNGSSAVPFQSLPSAVALQLYGFMIHFKKISLAFLEEKAKALHFNSLPPIWKQIWNYIILTLGRAAVGSHSLAISVEKKRKKRKHDEEGTVWDRENHYKDTCTNGSSARSSSWPSRSFFFTWSSHKGADWWPVSGCPTRISQWVHSWHKVQNYIITVVMDCKNNNNWEQAKTIWKYALSSWHSNCFCMFLKRKCYSEHFLISVAPKWKDHFWDYFQITAGC